MTEPQELRSIDELFKNTFNNLPDTPADSGWDTPSERVWDHVRDNIQAPKTGWSLQSLLLLAGFATILAVGLYFVFSSPEKVSQPPIETTVMPAASTAKTVAPTPETASVPVPETQPKRVVSSPRPTTSVVKKVQPEQEPQSPKPVNSDREIPRATGAAPLPGSNTAIIPNTTEALKLERAKQLAERWKTPLGLLPLPNLKKAKN